MRSRLIRFLALAAALAATAVLGACSSPVRTSGMATCAPPAGALILAVSAHQNAVAPDVPRSLSCTITSAILNHRPITVLGIDGTPAVEPGMQDVVFPVRTGNRAAAEQDTTKALGTVVAAVRSLRADSNGSDVIAALAEAHDIAASAGTGEATVVVLDPMIPDTGPLRLTDPGWAKADPKDVADFLAQNGNLPAGNHLHYVLVAVGYTAAPQKALTPAMRHNLTAIWTEVLSRGGATVTAQPDPRQGAGPKTAFTTATLAVGDTPQPPPCTAAPVVYDNASPVGFKPDQDTLRDPQAAAKALGDVASWLRADPHRHAHIVGTTANVGDLRGQIELSRRRAAAVQQLLIGLGVAPGQLDTDGVGSRFPEYQPDAGDPAAMQVNRSVRITLSGPSSC